MSSGENQRKYYPDEIGKEGLIGIFEGFTKEQKTQMGVAEAYHYYSRKGYIPYTPPPDLQKSGYDLLELQTFFTKRGTEGTITTGDDEPTVFSHAKNEKDGVLYSDASQWRTLLFVLCILSFFV